ncbi:hypothetical protein BST27_03560 [Mycobacterium intermedium]|uniref:Transmembrane protein n=1 Tax=Mycobacterium intermedium TaxID=28445 RepID=A0A1E3S841_MYCIE|nr:hypothetical protein [Mycobacterium intermedium]MCV6962789.1 hypothetical protein [Mycobacterium intermedium]ODQ98254.1 hypothetical protein BHQ20_22870 [Mycobacterium intermedium]OPE50611.1 hypothetical protein BV508_09565 [Mycobacterium intermedium]ORB09891.1 hypothetical protein BST27_03560 [Mycobacterium intermedium]
MRNAFRLLAFDILAPLAAVAGLLAIGNVLVWPWWWISACTALVLLIIEGVAVNFFLFRRDAVTVGTDDDAPGLRLAIAFLSAAALSAAVVTGYTHWTKPDREFKENSRTVVRIASGVAEAVASFSPGAPGASMDRAAAMMVPERANEFKQQYAKSSQEMIQRKVTAQATTLSAGVEAIGPTAASVAVILRVTQNAPGEQTSRAAPAVRVTLTKRGDDWLVEDVTPLNSR